MPGPALHTLVVADDPNAWDAAGFGVESGALGPPSTHIGTVRIQLIGRSAQQRTSEPTRSGIVAWMFEGLDDGSIDGITVTSAPHADRASGTAAPNANGATHLDHVVMMTPNVARSVAALELHGFEARRTREVPGTNPSRLQVFLWAGTSIIELVGPKEPSGDGPASLWGLAITSADLDATAELLGQSLGEPKPAVQPGRRIATLRTKALKVSVPIAFMSKHRPDSLDLDA